MVLAVPSGAAVAFGSLFHHTVAPPMYNLQMFAANAFYCWHGLQPVFVSGAYRPPNALEHGWNIAVRVPLKLELVSLSLEHLANVVVNVWPIHWPVNWPAECLQSMCFYVQQISV